MLAVPLRGASRLETSALSKSACLSSSCATSRSAPYLAYKYSHQFAARTSRLGGTKTGASGIIECAANSATHKAAARAKTRSRDSGCKLTSTLDIAPSHQRNWIAKIADVTVARDQNAFNAAVDASNGLPIWISAVAMSAIIERMNMADSALARAAGRTNSAATASSSASQATMALRP